MDFRSGVCPSCGERYSWFAADRQPEMCYHCEPTPTLAPLYEARGYDIWKLPQERRVGDKTHISLGFKVCTANRELLDEEGAANLAKMLDYAERYA
jgi:hypothetical protein